MRFLMYCPVILRVLLFLTLYSTVHDLWCPSRAIVKHFENSFSGLIDLVHVMAVQFNIIAIHVFQSQKMSHLQ